MDSKINQGWGSFRKQEVEIGLDEEEKFNKKRIGNLGRGSKGI